MSLIGIPIGFYAYLFPGNINLMMLQLHSEKRYRFLLFVFILALLFESLYCFLSLYFLSRFSPNLQVFKILEIVGYTLTMLMGFWMLFEKKYIRENKSQGNIYRGVFSIIIHPHQIPFWLFIGVLFHSILQNATNNWNLFFFVLCNTIGTGLILCTYAFFGKKILQFIHLNLNQINKIVGVSYISIAVYYFIISI